ncbi:major facilitator superfamily MFS_1 [Emticicia oligotrophica DSM 17448]|uniref:Major facilitator superfamily MFS_1 n=1 Tax=Emticicia oligotrophica (strain DSM 17448 / CIP 109782 / MTCC 6937 / GPTSA100-15) TaxID=929562 RepID=A0ABN4AQB1_EMTOG|nr:MULTISPECIES: MFS transporter [Emticicia]AFK03320.1 major facilitator superfamily MFS_1 [Emticicia oligotrophica DSM 17448]
MKQSKDPYAALRYPEFRYFISAQFLFTIAVLVQEVVISFYLYEITHDPLSLGLIGLFEAVPYISLALFGGYFADRRDKKTIIQICYGIIVLCSFLLLWVTYPLENHPLDIQKIKFVIYLTVFILGLARGFYGPAWSSLKPFLVPAEHYPNSASWSSQFWQSGMILGPASAGFLYSWLGLTNTLILVIVLFCVAFILVSLISRKPIQVPEVHQSIFKSLKEGIDFVLKNRILFYAILLDMFSVLFGGVVAILPVFAKDILQVGAEGLGILRAAPGIGAVLTMLGTAYFPPTRKAWRNMLIAVAGFGVATLVFALSTNFWLSVAALFLTGAFDSISVIVRQTILQVLPPDEMRGRVSGVNGIFVSCSNELGAFESGVAAKLLGPVNSVLFGGVMTLVIVSILYLRSGELFEVKLERN